jgi:carboxylesterase
MSDDPTGSTWPPAGGWPPPGAELMEGAAPWSHDGGPHGALVVHGFTGTPASMRPVAEALAEAGFAVSMPLLPGHGTTVEDLIDKRWDDWYDAVQEAYRDLAGQVDQVIVVGLSLGASLAAALTARHAEIAGTVCINAPVAPSPDMLAGLEALAESGLELTEGISSDVAKPNTVESAYDQTPVAAALSLVAVGEDLRATLSDIRCPLLIITSAQDHVVPPGDSDFLAEAVSGPVERVTLERSYHVATIDYDADLVVARVVEFAKRLTGA